MIRDDAGANVGSRLEDCVVFWLGDDFGSVDGNVVNSYVIH